MAQPGDVVATRACHDCKDRCQIKLNKNYMAYYFCPSCRANHRFNREISAELAAKYDRMAKKVGKPANDNTVGRIRTTGNDTERTETGQETATTEKGSTGTEKGKERASDATTAGTGHEPATTGTEAGIDTARDAERNGKRKTSDGDWLDDWYGSD